MKFLKFWFPVFLYSAIIFCVSSLPRWEQPIGLPFFDKAIHVVEYAILGFLFARALTNSTDTSLYSRNKIIWTTLLFCFIFGVSDEFHQSFVDGRFSTWGDIAADTIGGLLGGKVFKI